MLLKTANSKYIFQWLFLICVYFWKTYWISLEDALKTSAV